MENNEPEYGTASKGNDIGVNINLKRVLASAIQFWYLIVLSALVGVVIAYIINRYSLRIFPVRAAIIIKESEENIGAKFLYNNEIVNPYRNFYNEIYIMKSYPLLQEVIENLNFQVSIFSQGDIKNTEIYSPDFPIVFRVLNGSQADHGRSCKFKATSDETFELTRDTEDDELAGKPITGRFGDTTNVAGLQLVVAKQGDLGELKNQTFILVFNDLFQLARKYSNTLKVGWAEQGSSVVNLEVHGAVPRKEVDFLNKFIERYQQYDIEKKSRVAVMAMRFLDNQLRVIGDSLRLYEDHVEGFKRRNVITDMGAETGRLYNKVLSLEEQKFKYRLLDNYYAYVKDLLKSDNYQGIFTPASVGIDDDVVARLVNELISEQALVNLYSSNKVLGVERTEDNPALQAKYKKIAFLKGDILKTIENANQTQKINIKFIDDQIELVEDRLRKIPSTERELIAIQRNYSLRENLYTYLLQKRTEAGLSEASTTSDILVVNPPLAGSAISPKHFQNYTLGLGLGTIIPILLFVIIELVNNKIQSKEDIEQLTSIPIIGGVGHNNQQQVLIVIAKPRSAMAESFRSLRSNLNYFTGNKSKLVIMVTSSLPGEGKSFTALNLATVFALADKKTVVVGADLRKPKLFEELRLANETGLSQYLSNMTTIDSIIQKSTVENLSLISAGPMPPNPSELLLKPNMLVLLKELKERFDCIILDTPPLGYVTDAFVISSHADHTIFVIRQNYTPRLDLKVLEEYYKSKKLTNVSILFNDLRRSGLGYGYDGYAYSYNYNGQGYYFGRKGKRDNSYYHE